MESEEKFASFLQKVQQQSIFPECVRQGGKKYEVTTQELLKISPAEVARLRKILLSKSQAQMEFREKLGNEWIQCQKKVFNWLALAYSHLHHKTLTQLDDHDLNFLADISTGKPLPLIKYQLKTLLKQESRPKWSQEEDNILYQILAVECKYKTLGEWIYVSKELFLRGDHQSYKSAKNCRERWFNHVDPNLSKEWTREDDLTLFESVIKEGKRWALISSILNHTKNEHMIKNRFYSLIKKAQKGKNSNLDEEALVAVMIKDFKKQISINAKKEIGIEGKMKKETEAPLQQSKEETHQMRLLNSTQLFPSQMRDSQLLDQSQPLTTMKGFQAKLFQEEAQESEGKAQLLKLSQSLAYNVTYPSPIPVTPGSDLNLLGEGASGRGAFRFNYSDYIMKNTQFNSDHRS